MSKLKPKDAFELWKDSLILGMIPDSLDAFMVFSATQNKVWRPCDDNFEYILNPLLSLLEK